VHSIKDDSHPDIVDEIALRLRSRFGATVHLLLENQHNEPERLVRRSHKRVLYTAQWNDDVHHVLHVAATQEKSGYYADYGETKLLVRALAEGFAYQGDISPYRGAPCGGASAELPPGAFVAFIQNHDQIGNRAFGERLTALASASAVRALASVYLLLPQTPMLFMGEEWGSEQPFPFFYDFEGELAEAVRQGRRKEFARFPEFADPERAAKMPDPIAEKTFLLAKLDWSGIDAERLGFYRAALAARQEHVRPLLPKIDSGGEGEVLGEQAVRVVWRAGARRLILDANLADGRIAFPETTGVFWRCGETEAEFGPWSVRWSIGEP